MGLSSGAKQTGILYRRNNGDGTFGPIETLGKPSGFATSIEAKDFDGDGRCDVLVTSTHTGTVELFSHRIAPAPPSYASWCQLHGVFEEEVDADDDHDGVTNIFEYVAGTSPSVPNAPSGGSLKIQNFAEGDILTYTRPRLPSGTSVEIDAEWSLDLQQWYPAPHAAEISVHMDSPDRETMRWKIRSIEATDEWPLPNMFYRFKARRPAEQ